MKFLDLAKLYIYVVLRMFGANLQRHVEFWKPALFAILRALKVLFLNACNSQTGALPAICTYV